MTNTQIAEALLRLRPGAQWCLTGDDYLKLEWFDKIQKPPTLDEVTKNIASYVPPVIVDRIAILEANVAILMKSVPTKGAI